MRRLKERQMKMAEGEGFEPSVRITPYTGLANQRLKPLGHPSGFSRRREERGMWPLDGWKSTTPPREHGRCQRPNTHDGSTV